MKKSFATRLASLFSFNKAIDDDFFDDLEDLLIEGDMGAALTYEIIEKVQEMGRRKRLDKDSILALLKEELGKYIEEYDPAFKKGDLQLLLVLGVNGVGKTTTIAKLAAMYKMKGLETVMSAADTFRAAAIDQLALHAERVGCRIVKQNHGSDPGAVIYDTITSAVAKGEDLILADTAGRMHTKENLLRELQKIDRIIRNRIEAEHYRKVLVVDATTGQNCLRQAEMFHQAIGIDALVLTKYDSFSKGGSIVQIGKQLGIPISYIGTGEKYSDIMRFDKKDFLEALLSG